MRRLEETLSRRHAFGSGYAASARKRERHQRDGERRGHAGCAARAHAVPEVGRDAGSPIGRRSLVTLLGCGTGDDRSLESRIGSQWFNRIGILAVLIGVAWFLKLAIDNHWIGPLGRV